MQQEITRGLIRRCKLKRKNRKCNCLMEYVGSTEIAGTNSLFIEDWYCKKCNTVHRLFVMTEDIFKRGLIQ